MIKAGLIDELLIFTAPKILGAGPNFVGELGIDSITQALALELTEIAQFGGDLMTRYRVPELAVR